jgi:glutathione S-transferase
MRLHESDIKTREVLGWTGLHLFHYHTSSCSQKVRILMNLKGISYKSHVVDLRTSANITEYYLGINPRGLVPTLVHDGDVHIESNDILTYLEGLYPDPPLIPPGFADEVATLLRHEDDLHLDFRTIMLRFLAPSHPPKSTEELERYATMGTGMVGGVPDTHLEKEIAFWTRFAEGGISDEAARRSVQAFRKAFDEIEQRLVHHPYLMGDAVSVLDIAWLIYVDRLRLSGYPVMRMHRRLGLWANKLSAHPAFEPEIAMSPEFAAYIDTQREALAAAGRTMESVCSL